MVSEAQPDSPVLAAPIAPPRLDDNGGWVLDLADDLRVRAGPPRLLWEGGLAQTLALGLRDDTTWTIAGEATGTAPAVQGVWRWRAMAGGWRADVELRSAATGTAPRIESFAWLGGDAAALVLPTPSDVTTLAYGSDMLDAVVSPLRTLERTLGRGAAMLAGPDGRTVLLGHLAARHGRADVWIDTSASSDATVALEATWDGAWTWPSGTVLPLDPICMLLADSTAVVQAAWAAAFGAEVGVVPDRPRPRGWWGWAWSDVFDDEPPTHDLVVASAAAWKVAGLSRLGADLVWISISYVAGLTPGRYDETDRERFPGGLEGLVRELQEHGMRLGLWCAPFWVADTPEMRHRWEGRLLTDERGAPVVQKKGWQYGDSAARPAEDRFDFLCLDGSHPEVKAHLRTLFANWRSVGVEYCMVDFLDAGAGSLGGRDAVPATGRHDGRAPPGTGPYREALAAIREGAGPDMTLLGATGPMLEALPMVDAMRIASDHDEGRPRAPETFWHPATYLADHWAVHRRVLRAIAARAPLDRHLWSAAHAHSLVLDEPVSGGQARISAALAAVGGGILLSGDDPRRMSSTRLDLLRRVLPEHRGPVCSPDAMRPLGAEATPMLLRADLDADGEQWCAVAVFNLEDEPKTVEFAPSWLPPSMQAASSWSAFEMFDRAALGRITAGSRLHIPALDARILRITSRREHPWLLATDHHLTGGGVELSSVAWDPGTRRLSLVLEHAPAAEGRVWISCPRGWRPVHWRSARIVRLVGHADDVMQVEAPLDDAGRWEGMWAFERIDANGPDAEADADR